MTSPPPARLPGDLWRYLASVASSNLGDGIRFGALPLLTASITRDPIAVAAVTGITMLPWFLFGAVGGAIVDRTDRKRLIIVTQVARAGAVGILAAAIATDRAGLGLVYAVAFVIGLGEVLVDTASQAAIPQLAGDGSLEQANSRMVGAQLATGEIIGLPLGATLFGVAAVAPFAVDAATFVAGALLIATVRRPLQDERTEARQHLTRDVRDGFGFLWRHEFLRPAAIAVGLSNLAFTATSSLFVLLVVDVLDAPAIAFGILGAVGAIGGLLGSLLSRRIIDRFGRVGTLIGGGAVGIVAQGAIGLSPNVAFACGCFFVASFTIVATNVIGQSLRQAVTPDRLLGRVVASYRVIGLGGVPLGALIGGVIASFTGIRSVFAVSTAIGLIAVAMLERAVRHVPPALLAGTAAEPATRPVDQADAPE